MKRKLIYIFVFLVICYALYHLAAFLSNFSNFNELRAADYVNIYQNGELVLTSHEPSQLFKDTDINGSMVILGVRKKKLYTSWLHIRTAYVLKFYRDDKKIGTIKVLSPKNEKAIAKIESKDSTNWYHFNGEYAVLYKRLKLFALGGDTFFDNLASLLDK